MSCILSNGINTQGANSLLAQDNPLYNANDLLRCVGNFIGIQTHGGISTINDSSEATLNIDDVKIGRPQRGWTLSFKLEGTNSEMIDFKIDYVMEDRIIGVYKLSLSLLKQETSKSNIQVSRLNGGM